MFDEIKNNSGETEPQNSPANNENTEIDTNDVSTAANDEFFSSPTSLDFSDSSDVPVKSCFEAAVEEVSNSSEVPYNAEGTVTPDNIVDDPVPQTPIYYHKTTPIADTSVASHPEAAPSYCGGVAYTKMVDGKVASGYEWDGSHLGESYHKKEKKAKKDSSGTGFRVFVISILSVFALSIVTMVGALTFHIISINNSSAPENNKAIESEEKDIPFDSSAILTEKDKAEFDNVVTSTPIAPNFTPYDDDALSIPEIAAKCSPSSVGIISEVEISYNNYPFYFPTSPYLAQASGSGFIYSDDGYVITNHHVIEDAKTIKVVLYDGTEYEAELVGSDALSDIAVLKITPDENVTLVPMEIGDSDKLVVGEQVVAIGCPAGIDFIGTVTDGIISAINRNIELTDNSGRVQKIMTLIQTNATINHGNSGGPLINTRGQVIGINTLKLAEDYEGIGFSIPINGAVDVIEQLIQHGKVVERNDSGFVSAKGIIGINGADVTEDESEYYEVPRGVLVVQIDNNSSAAQNGLRRGDIITHYNGKEVFSVEDINKAKGSASAGASATVTIYRMDDNNEGQTFDIHFTLMADE